MDHYWNVHLLKNSLGILPRTPSAVLLCSCLPTSTPLVQMSCPNDVKAICWSREPLLLIQKLWPIHRDSFVKPIVHSHHWGRYRSITCLDHQLPFSLSPRTYSGAPVQPPLCFCFLTLKSPHHAFLQS